MIRSFLALPIPEDTADALIAVQETIPFGRAVAEDNLHLTLAFMGQVHMDVLEALDDMLTQARLPAPEILFDGLGTFAETDQGLVFASVAQSETLSALQSKVAGLARQAGADLPRRRFRAHVTLMRANRQPKGLDRDQLALALGRPLEIPAFRADQLCLYRSELSQKGALHEVMAEYPLG